MAKKKPTINLSSKNLTFIEGERHFKIITFNQEKMVVSCIVTENTMKNPFELPFAHLPKSLKQQVNKLQ